MSDALATEITKLLAQTLKENGAIDARLKSIEPEHYKLLQEIEMLKRSRDQIQNQRDRAQEELRKIAVDAPKFKALYESADTLRKASRRFKALHPAGDKLNKALHDAYDCIDWIPF